MPDYVTMAAMNARIPGPYLIQALDDDGDGAADSQAWSDVQKAVEDEINGILGTRFPVPFANPVPAVVLNAAQVLAADALYRRRGTPDESNPFAAQAGRTNPPSGVRGQLMSIAKGELPLTPEIKRQAPSASVITERAKTTSSSGQTAA
jgi:phage gp36-like protein